MKEDVAVALVEFVGVEEEADVSVMLAEAKMEKLASRVGEGSFSIAVCIRLPVRSCTKAALLTNRDGTLQKKKKVTSDYWEYSTSSLTMLVTI